MRVIARDDGNGNLVAVSVGDTVTSTVLGTVNYSTGAVTLQAGKFMVRQVSYPQYEIRSGRLKVVGYGRIDVLAQFSAGTIVSVSWLLAGDSAPEAQETLPLPAMQLQLTPTVSDSVVPGSVRFTFRGRTYVDRSGGLYHSIDPGTGAGIYAGTVDYTSGVVNMTQWVPGGNNTVQVLSLLTRIADPGVAFTFFRAPGSPLRPGMFTLRANRLDGELITATADINGDISSPQMRGKVDWESGVAKVRTIQTGARPPTVLNRTTLLVDQPEPQPARGMVKYGLPVRGFTGAQSALMLPVTMVPTVSPITSKAVALVNRIAHRSVIASLLATTSGKSVSLNVPGAALPMSTSLQTPVQAA
jgi:hypothetical protein